MQLVGHLYIHTFARKNENKIRNLLFSAIIVDNFSSVCTKFKDIMSASKLIGNLSLFEGTPFEFRLGELRKTHNAYIWCFDQGCLYLHTKIYLMRYRQTVPRL